MFWHSRPLSLFSAISYIYISHSQFLAFHNHISKPLLGNAWPFAFCGHCWSCHLPSTMKSNWQGWGPSRTIFIQAMFQAMSASAEILAMFPVVRHFVYTVVQPHGHCPAECYALLAMAMAIDQVHDGNQAGVTTRASLLAAMEEAIDHFAAAFDTPLIKKWHWMLHLPDSLARHGLLPNCFASERKHKPIGALANNLQNQNHFEQHLLSQAVAKEISFLDQPNLFPRRCLPSESQRCFKESAGQLELVPGDTCWPSLDLTFCQSKGSHLQFRRCGIVPCWQPCAPTLASCWNQAPFWFPRPCHNFGQCMGFATIFSQESNTLFALHPQTWGSFPQKTSWHQWFGAKMTQKPKCSCPTKSTAKICEKIVLLVGSFFFAKWQCTSLNMNIKTMSSVTWRWHVTCHSLFLHFNVFYFWPHMALWDNFYISPQFWSQGTPSPATHSLQLRSSHHGPSAGEPRGRSPSRSCQPRRSRPTNHHWLDQIGGGWKPRVVVPKVFHTGMQVLDLAHQDQKSSQPSL